ncbi:MAG: flavin reductase [Actinobacteria bacterium]|uniref:Unannotated protein n=1 Tax=freshwater metagenome TaxID=449393 RepID=A0A6J6RVQ9_9ZZZZ|nr:flavin reductase [Actinomycetota bacterium]MSY13548.1 flavin reductase [Actinomycetota bacterium]MSZ03970.1 flavin reductase [Actinomycetota bacterium]MTB06608.1 flavin reductase [Actinomycetota bacterium]
MSNFDTARFRQVLGHLPTGVTIVTGLSTSGEPGGLTIGSFCSVSLEPPLVGFLPAVNSRSWADIAPGGSFCVNILGAEQGELCWRFAKDSEGRFDGIDWQKAPSGSPILPGAIGWIDCSTEQVIEMGDHWFVLGRVGDLHCEDDVSDAMTFFKGKVCSVKMG